MAGIFQCFLYVSFRVCRKTEKNANAERKKSKDQSIEKFPHVVRR